MTNLGDNESSLHLIEDIVDMNGASFTCDKRRFKNKNDGLMSGKLPKTVQKIGICM